MKCHFVKKNYLELRRNLINSSNKSTNGKLLRMCTCWLDTYYTFTVSLKIQPVYCEKKRRKALIRCPVKVIVVSLWRPIGKITIIPPKRHENTMRWPENTMQQREKHDAMTRCWCRAVASYLRIVLSRFRPFNPDDENNDNLKTMRRSDYKTRSHEDTMRGRDVDGASSYRVFVLLHRYFAPSPSFQKDLLSWFIFDIQLHTH